jgi:hypothetical protein
VPDLAAAARMLDLGNAPEAEVRQTLGTGFSKHPLHKIVCIGALIASRQPEGWRIDALGAPHIGERPDFFSLLSALASHSSQCLGQSFSWMAMLVNCRTFGGNVAFFYPRKQKAAFRLCSVKSQWPLAVSIERNRGADVRRKSTSQRWVPRKRC